MQSLPNQHVFTTLSQFFEHLAGEKTFTTEHLTIGSIPAHLQERKASTRYLSVEEVCKFLEKLLLPLGRTLSCLNPSQNRNVAFFGGAVWDVQSTIPLTFQMEYGPLELRIKDLFSLMIYSRVEKVRISPGQKLIAEEAETPRLSDTKPKINLHQLASNSLPEGYQYRLDFHEEESPSIEPSIVGEINQEKNTFSIVSSHGIDISLAIDSNHIPFSTFRNYLLKHGTLLLNKDACLHLRDPSIPRLYREYQEKYQSSFLQVTPASFFLGHLFLPEGLTLNEIGGPIEFAVDGIGITFTSKNPCELKLQIGKLYTTVKDLGESLLSKYQSVATEGQNRLVFRTNQPIVLYDVSEEEFQEFHTRYNKTDGDANRDYLDAFFYRRSPPGFCWGRTSSGYVIGISQEQDQSGTTHTYFRFTPTTPTAFFEMELKPAFEGEFWVLSVLNRSSNAFLEEFKSPDTPIMWMTVIKLVLQYCAVGHFYLPKPTFFKDVVPLYQLITKYPRQLFKDLLAEMDDPTLFNMHFHKNSDFVEIPQLFSLLPDDFDKQKADNHSTLANQLMNELMAIAGNEIQNGPLLKCLTNVSRGLRLGSYNPFLISRTYNL